MKAFRDGAGRGDAEAVDPPSASGLEGYDRSEDPAAALRLLSRRELETFDLVVNGRTTKEISTVLGISRHTADHYRRRVYEKLGVQGVVGIVRYAARAGWFRCGLEAPSRRDATHRAV
ncbi:response regulator transcription factor [Solimonas terrae]|uniref:Helix-turn-helix transcriptional regulator n=1 Tax=Solimonas terrae TaxID=1396819 RepID=A0A6M2BP01_9GAMM|nr:helix-turn-helix transcriptional regulator [Solimonas terrae]NGY04094.1 helix-turn-helix transcriptional regulator [Solimonas terrae]